MLAFFCCCVEFAAATFAATTGAFAVGGLGHFLFSLCNKSSLVHGGAD